MPLKPLEQLRLELRQRGYSHKYIERLCAELEDHVLSAAAAESRPASLSDSTDMGDAYQRLGSDQQLVRAVTNQETLAPYVVRYPLVAMTLLPGLFVCAACWLVVVVAWWLAKTDDSPWLRQAFIVGYPGANSTVWFLLGALVAVVAQRYRIDFFRVFLTTALLTLGASIDVQLVDCGYGAPFFRVLWEDVSVRWLLPWFGLACGCFGWTLFKPNQILFRGAATEGNGTAAMCAVAIACLFVAGFQHLKKSTTTHPADKLIEGMIHLAQINNTKVGLLKDEYVLETLGVTPQQASVITEQMSLRDLKLAEISRHMTDGKQSIVYDPTWADEPNRQFLTIVERSLSADQRYVLSKQLVRKFGSSGLFLPEVNQRMGLREQQTAQLKDLVLELTRAKQEQMLQSLRTQPVDHEALLKNQKLLDEEFSERMRQVLTPYQQQVFKSMQ